jgi:hypothetical protein
MLTPVATVCAQMMAERTFRITMFIEIEIQQHTIKRPNSLIFCRFSGRRVQRDTVEAMKAANCSGWVVSPWQCGMQR